MSLSLKLFSLDPNKLPESSFNTTNMAGLLLLAPGLSTSEVFHVIQSSLIIVQ